jgi:hypothetical protein
MVLGRPTKYTPELFEKAETYLDYCDKHPLKRYLSNGTSVPIPQPPTINGFGLFLDVNHQTMINWCGEYPEFLALFEKIKAEGERILAQNGLSDGYNANLAKFLLSSDHNKREKTGVDITSGDEKIELVMFGGGDKIKLDKKKYEDK